MARVTRVVSRNVFESIAQLMEQRTAAATSVVHREMVKKISKPGNTKTNTTFALLF